MATSSSSASSASPLASSSQGPLDSARGRASASLGFEAPPAHLALAQVHYLVRHGERTPVRTRLTNSNPAIPARWNFCHAGRQFATAVSDLTPTEGAHRLPAGPWQKKGEEQWRGTMRVAKGTESTKRDTPVPGEEGECLLGELTDLGRASTFQLGAALRALYIDQLQLLPSRLSPQDAEAVYFRSTNMSRTIESCQSLIRGLLPQTREKEDAFTPTILVRNGTDENLLPNTFGCARLRVLDGQFAAFAASQHASHLATFDAAVAPHCDGTLPRVDGHPRLNGIVDTIRAAQAHALPVPKVFERPDVVEAFETAVVDEWFTGYKAQDEALRKQYRRLAMGRLLGDLQGRMQSKAEKGEQEKLKLALYSAHDTSLAGLLSTLDVFEQRWPSFTASVGIELWRDTRASAQPSLLSFLGLGRSTTQHYVRMRYGDSTLRLPACAGKGQHLDGKPEFCTLEAFGEAVEALRHEGGKTWEEECEEGRGAKSSK